MDKEKNCCGHNHEENCGGGCGCGCGDHEHDHAPIIVELEDENGNVIECEIVEGFMFEEKEYAVVLNPENEEVYIFRVEGTDDVGELVVPEEDEFNRVMDFYETLLEADELEEV